MSRVLAAAVVCLAMATAGCLPIPRLSGDRETDCTREFQLSHTNAVLGSEDDLVRVTQEFAAGNETTTLEEIAQKAGWRPAGWDHLEGVVYPADSADINKAVGSTGICYRGISWGDPDRVSEIIYIFVDGTNPVQAIRSDDMLFIWSEGVLRKDTPLVPDHSYDPPVLNATPGPSVP